MAQAVWEQQQFVSQVQAPATDDDGADFTKRANSTPTHYRNGDVIVRKRKKRDDSGMQGLGFETVTTCSSPREGWVKTMKMVQLTVEFTLKQFELIDDVEAMKDAKMKFYDNIVDTLQLETWLKLKLQKEEALVRLNTRKVQQEMQDTVATTSMIVKGSGGRFYVKINPCYLPDVGYAVVKKRCENLLTQESQNVYQMVTLQCCEHLMTKTLNIMLLGRLQPRTSSSLQAGSTVMLSSSMLLLWHLLKKMEE